MNETNRAEAAKHIHGATIAWGAGSYLDLADPDSIRVGLEDYAYCLAYTVRWRGQARTSWGRPFYGVGQHVVFGAEELLAAGHSAEDAVEFLFHESDEVPFGDFPGPAKPLIRDTCHLAKRVGESINRGFGIEFRNPDLIKQWDIRMLVTEKRDILSPEFHPHDWLNGGSGQTSTVGYEPFARRIVPFEHPEMAAIRFLDLCKQLGVTDA